jgi:hypothetical protein
MTPIRVVTVLVSGLLLAAMGAQAAEPQPPRLKYRARGAVCACDSGMSEDEIRKAWEARFGAQATQPARSVGPGDAPATTPRDAVNEDDKRKEAGR